MEKISQIESIKHSANQSFPINQFSYFDVPNVRSAFTGWLYRTSLSYNHFQIYSDDLCEMKISCKYLRTLYSTGQVLQGFSLLDALATVRFIPFFILIFVVSASLSAIGLNSKNKIEERFWTLDRLTKNTIEYERVQAFWMIIHTVGNIPVIAVIPEALSIALMLISLIAVERIAAFALRGIEQHHPSKLIPLICFNSIATIALGVLFTLNPFGGPLAIEFAIAFTSITNLVLTITRWREYGKALPTEMNNCPV